MNLYLFIINNKTSYEDKYPAYVAITHVVGQMLRHVEDPYNVGKLIEVRFQKLPLQRGQ